jgi:hypothetical protein
VVPPFSPGIFRPGLNTYFEGGFIMKKNLLFGLIAVLTAILVFTGCPTGGGTDNDDNSGTGNGDETGKGDGTGGGGPPPPSIDAEKAALDLQVLINNAQKSTAVAIGTTVELQKSLTIGNVVAPSFQVSRATAADKAALPDLTIPSGVTLEVQSGFMLKVEGTGEVTVAGTLSTEGAAEIVVAGGTFTTTGTVAVATGGTLEATGGTVKLGGPVTVAGTLDVTTTVTVTGAITVKKGGALITEEDLGTIKVEAGAIINDVTQSKSGSLEELPKIVTITDVTISTAPTFETGKSYVLKPSSGAIVTLSSVSVSIPIGNTFSIPKGVTLEVGANTLTVNGTLTVAGALTVTSGSGSIAGNGKIIVSGGTSTGSPLVPSLDGTGSYNHNTHTIAYAKKDLATGAATIELGGSVTGFPAAVVNDIWGAKGSDVGDSDDAAYWSSAVIVGIIPSDHVTADNLEIKQSNLSLYYYKGGFNAIDAMPALLVEPTTTPITIDNTANGGPSCLYLSSDGKTAVRWVKYGTGRSAFDSDTGFGVLLWNKATSKTATFDITPSGGTKYNVTVDWSGVEFKPVP